MGPLLPKLRGQFAEFLNHSSPERLSILYSTTCVGLGYGPHTHSLEAFLDSTGSLTSPSKRLRITPQGTIWYGFAYTNPYTLTPQSNKWPSYPTASPHHLATTRLGPTHHHQPTPTQRQDKQSSSGRQLVSLIHHGRIHAGTGISTRYPSTTPVGLALGPDSPWEDELDPGTLSHTAGEILTHHSLLMPAFSLAHTPHHVHTGASTHARRSPTQHTTKKMMSCRGFGGVLQPHYIVGAQPLDQ